MGISPTVGAAQGASRLVALVALGLVTGCLTDFTGVEIGQDGAIPQDAATEVDGAEPGCGNGLVELAEECDGADLGGATCATVSEAFSIGDLGCLSSCLFDTSGCVPKHCGDGQVNLDEECDDGNSSDSDGCLSTCLVATCGDGHLWPAHEECDDGNDSDEDGCVDACEVATCGDGHLWVGHEQCDGVELGGATCESLGFAQGTLTCTAACEYETSGCIPCGACKTCTIAECYRDVWWWEDSACTVPSAGCQPCTHWGPASSTHSDGSFFCFANGSSSPYWNGGPCDWVDTVYQDDCDRCGTWTCP